MDSATKTSHSTPINDHTLNKLRGLGPKTAQLLKKLDIYTIPHLLLHLPLRFEDRTRICPIEQLIEGQNALIEGEVVATNLAQFGRKTSTCVLKTATGTVNLRFFRLTPFHRTHLQPGHIIRCYGAAKWHYHQWELQQPDIERMSDSTLLPAHYTGIYPTTQGLSQKKIAKLIAQAFEYARTQALFSHARPALSTPAPPLPCTTLMALQQLHYPPNHLNLEHISEALEPWRRFVAEEELIGHIQQIHIHQAQAKTQPAQPLILAEHHKQAFFAQLPFELTSAQVHAWEDIKHDLAQSHPMQRLLQGDVGSGKTVLAALCAITAAYQHTQCALMVPTELLAQQHYQQLTEWLENTDISVGLLTGSQPTHAQRSMLEKVRAHQVDIIIGTQALFQDRVEFANLSMVLIDEQHRFGVAQRWALQAKNTVYTPHQLTLTATPIPRTLAISLYGVLAVSALNELPKGRKPIITAVMPEIRRSELIERLTAVLAAGEQVFWVCPLIEASEALALTTAAEDTFMFLQQALPDYPVGLVHGRLKEVEKQHIINDFKSKALQVLVATTVIEVGMNVPNANLLVIENSERMGLAQLHQLRGRVGRGHQQAYCVLLYKTPLSDYSRKRLEIIRNCQNGFDIAEADLTLRGPGQWFGTRQSGLLNFRIARLETDHALMPLAEAYCHNMQNSASSRDLLTQVTLPWQATHTTFSSS